MFLLQFFTAFATNSIMITQIEATIWNVRNNALRTIKNSQRQIEPIIDALNNYVTTHNTFNPNDFRNLPPYYFCDYNMQIIFQENVDTMLGDGVVNVQPWFSKMRKYVAESTQGNEVFSRYTCPCTNG